jgi:hypothetical protein
MICNFYVNKLVVAAQFSAEETRRLLFAIQNEKMFVLLEKIGRDLELHSWLVNTQTSLTTIRSHSNVSTEMGKNRSVKLLDRHLLIATLSYPPSVVINVDGSIRGIEPSVMESLADHTPVLRGGDGREGIRNYFPDTDAAMPVRERRKENCGAANGFVKISASW